MTTPLPPLSRWALDEARSLDERYLLLLLADACRLERWRAVPNEQRPLGCLDCVMGRDQRNAAQLRPLELPPLSRADAVLLEEMAPLLKSFSI